MMGKCPPPITRPRSFPLFRPAPLFFRPRRSRHPASVFSPGGFRTQSRHSAVIVFIIIIGSFSRSAGIHGNQGKCHQLLGEYQYRQASINIAVTHYQSNGEAATVGLDYK